MKKIKILFIFTLIFFGINKVSAFDTTQKVYDYADVLTSNEEQELKELANEYIDKYDMDMVMVTVKYHNKSTTKIYAQDFYDYNGFGIGSTYDGILFVIDFTFGYRDIYMLTTGNSIIMYDDARINNILDSVANVSDSNYYNWFKTFVNKSNYYASLGKPSSNSHVHLDSKGDPYVIPWGWIIIISLIIPTVVLIIFINKNKMIKKSTNANLYIKDGSVNITTKNDKFITTHTTSYRINTSSSSSGGSRIGGSSISRGSSGRSHGGGGRRL